MCIAAAIAGGAVVGAGAQLISSDAAADAQTSASNAGIGEQRRQFDAIRELLKPFTQAGTSAVGAQSDLLGLSGADKQAAALKALQSSPEFAALQQQGEEGILQNASATGGLRGGNTQAALAQFRPQLLSALIQQRFGQLGQVAGLGQASAAGTAAAAQNSGNAISDLLGQAGQARAGQAMANGQAFANMGNSFATLALLKGMKVF